MKLFIRAIFLLILTTGCLKAQINKTLPEWINSMDLKNIGSVNKKQIKDGYYYILIDEQYNQKP
jgi:hypothetical protein